jgi:tetrahydromethanopterin S-methyltransferase subunit F
MSDKELTQLILNALSNLERKVDSLKEEVADLRTEAELIKRDKSWGKWLAGIVGSALTLIISIYMRKL